MKRNLSGDIFNFRKIHATLLSVKSIFTLLIILTFSQSVFSNGGIGYKGIYINKNGTKTWYKAHNVSWSYSGCGNFQFNSASDFSGQELGTFTSSEALQISGFAVIGWTDNSDYIAGKLQYRIWKQGESEPVSWTEINVGNYGNYTAGVAQVVCSYINDRVVGYDDGITNINPGAPGTYNFKIKALGQMQYTSGGGGFYNVNDGSEVTATFTITSSTTDYFRSKATGNWNIASNWESSANNSAWAESTVVPGTSANVTTIRNGHIITLTATAESRLITINSGGELVCGSQTLNLASNATLTNNGTFSSGFGTVAFAGSGTISGTVGFYIVTLAGGVDFGSGSTINGALVINNGGYVNTNPPVYASGSNLKYNSTGTYGRSTEWSTTSGAGYPHDVNISNNTTLNLGNGEAGTARQCAGNLLIDNGSALSMNETGAVMTAALTVTGNITNNGTLTLGGSIGGDLNLKGNWVTTGTFNHNSRAVTFNSTSAQEIQSGATTFGYLTIDNSAGVSLNGSGLVTVADNLTINSGKVLNIKSGKSLTLSGTLTNSAGNSGLVVESGGSLIQNSAVSATVQRSISAWTDANHGWHFLSSPVSSQAISPDFVTDPATNYDFYCWYESSNLWVNYKNTTVAPTWNTANVLGGTSGEGNFIPGKGYLVAYAALGTKEFTGTLNKDNIFLSNLSFTSNRGWHLLGNPFSSALTWGTIDWALTDNNIYGTAKIWNEANASYTDVASGTGIIPALNGFMVAVTGATNSLTIPTAARTHATTPSWYKSTVSGEIKLKAIDISGQTAQESIIHFLPEATTGIDTAFDSQFLAGYAPEFYSLAGSEHLSTNALPDAGGVMQIPFGFVKNSSSDFSIVADTILNVFGPVILTDLKTGATQDLKQNPVYAFTSATGDNPERFMLSFGHVGVNDPLPVGTVKVHASGKTIVVASPVSLAGGRAEVYDLLGKKVLDQPLGIGLAASFGINGASGYYIVRVITPSNSVTSKVFIH